jgi:subtilisin family serine protease
MRIPGLPRPTALPALGVDVLRVAPAAREQVAARLRTLPGVASVETDVTVVGGEIPNDRLWRRQWGARDVRMPALWERTVGRRDVIVAVIDTGVDRVPELSGRVLVGRDYVNDDRNASDDHGHGTKVAGIVAAAGDNRRGIAGVCWRCRILPVKVIGRNNHGLGSDVAAAIVWAADRGADVINLSLGSHHYRTYMQRAVRYARSRGAVVIGAALNHGNTRRGYPAAYRGAIGVAAMRGDGSRYGFSSYGRWVDVAAPGCARTTYPRGYGDFCGTSAAAPFASGVAALLLSARPNATRAEVERALRVGATGSPSWVYAGRLDAVGALRALDAIR